MLAILFRDGKEVRRLYLQKEPNGTPPLFIRVPHHRQERYDPNSDPSQLIAMFQEVFKACTPACCNCGCTAYHSQNNRELVEFLRGQTSETDWRYQVQYA